MFASVTLLLTQKCSEKEASHTSTQQKEIQRIELYMRGQRKQLFMWVTDE